MLLETIKLALTSIWRNALRSVLTLLGVTIGVAAVIAMVTLGEGTTAQVSSSISSLGSNLLMIRPGQSTPGSGTLGSSNFRLVDVAAIERQVDGIKTIVPIAATAVTVVSGANNHQTTVYGADNRYLAIRQWQLSAGREFRDGELASGAASCIIGATVARELLGDADPLERSIRLKSFVCKVIGVLEAKGASLGLDQDDLVVMPLRTFQRRIAGNSDVNQIQIEATSEDAIEQIKSEAVSVLRERRHLSAREEDDFTVMDQREVSSLLGTVMGILTGLLAAIAGISLLVGGIGIMNIMLVSVTERTREIGIRLAIGARESQVLLQFLVEAAALSTLGGLIGIALGLGIAAATSPLLGVPFVLNYWAVVLAFGFSSLVGVAFGYFPARGAARLDPIEALRHE